MPNRSGMQRFNDINFSEESERIIAVVITAQLQEIRTEIGDMQKKMWDTIYFKIKLKLRFLNVVNLLKS